MLYEIYQPILWRAISAANALVRHQAACFFIDVFPMRVEVVPEDNHHHHNDDDKRVKKKLEAMNDALLQKQFDTLLNLLFDPATQVGF